MNGLASLKTAFRVNLAFKMMQKFNPSKNLQRKKQERYFINHHCSHRLNYGIFTNTDDNKRENKKNSMKETLQFNLYHSFTKICQIKPYSVLYQQNNCNTSTDVQSYQHHKMLFTSTSIIHQIYHLTSDFVDLVANI